MTKPFIMGVDLGKLTDWTAITIIEEKLERHTSPTIEDLRIADEGRVLFERVYHLRHMERPDQGTPYDRIIERIAALLNTPELKDKTELVVDATGVGGPVIDMMRRAGLRPIPVTITFGSAIRLDEQGGFHVSKYDLVAALQAWWAMRRLKVAARLPLVESFLKEVQNFVPKITKANNVTYEALREGDHDDLVLSAALAVWYASYTRPWKAERSALEKPEKPYHPFDYLDEGEE